MALINDGWQTPPNDTNSELAAVVAAAQAEGLYYPGLENDFIATATPESPIGIASGNQATEGVNGGYNYNITQAGLESAAQQWALRELLYQLQDEFQVGSSNAYGDKWTMGGKFQQYSDYENYMKDLQNRINNVVVYTQNIKNSNPSSMQVWNVYDQMVKSGQITPPSAVSESMIPQASTQLWSGGFGQSSGGSTASTYVPSGGTGGTSGGVTPTTNGNYTPSAPPTDEISQLSTGVPQLLTPSRQYEARMGPTAQQQYYGYEQYRTGARPEETQYRLWSGAPPSGNAPRLSFGR